MVNTFILLVLIELVKIELALTELIDGRLKAAVITATEELIEDAKICCVEREFILYVDK